LPSPVQAELLDRARRQGHLLASQLPAPPASERPEHRARQLVQAILDGVQLDAARPAPFQAIDHELDAAQRDAVAGALATPDLFLLRGVTGTGKSRCVVELVRQAVRAGKRVLIASPSDSAIDGLLERFAGCPEILACRAAGRGEVLSDTARRHLTAEREAAFVAGLTEVAARTLAERQAKNALAATLPSIWDRVETSIHRVAELEAAVAAASAEPVPEEVAPPTQVAEIDTTSRAAIERLEAEACQHDARANAIAAELERKKQAFASLQPASGVKNGAKWWTVGYWLGGDTGAKLVELHAAITAGELEIASANELAAGRRREALELEAATQTDREAALAAERERLAAEAADRLSRLRDDLALAEAGLGKMVVTAQAAGAPPLAAMTTEAVAEARLASAASRLREAEAIAFDEEWHKTAASHVAELTQAFRAAVNVVAGPVGALVSSCGRGAPFDLLVIDEAHWLAEADFHAAARLARRWLLVGEPSPETIEVIADHRRGAAGRGRRKGPDFFARLWQRLHLDVWSAEEGRLCCRLSPVPAEQRGAIESESVADFPDVELRIFAPEGADPQLAEVVFPPGMPLVQAKEYLFRELNEVTLYPAGSPTRVVTDSSIAVRWPEFGRAKNVNSVTLDKGVTEFLAGVRTVAVEFDRSMGWDEAEADKWLGEHIDESGRHPGRTAELVTLHRMCPELGTWMSEVAFAGRAALPDCERPPPGVCVDFHPVPGFGDDRRRGSKRDAGPRRVPGHLRGGAGLDVDLGDPRQRERIPADLIEALPKFGFVNYPEALAVVRHLESFAINGPPGRSAVVTALYTSQAELIRLLVARSAAAERIATCVRVVPPASLAGAEFDHVIVSLTRSHGSRAVTFGEDPRDSLRLLGRARKKLVLFGDPGTLVRRSQWEGAVDQLDEPLAKHEREWVTGLVRYLQGEGERPAAFQLHEGLRL